MGKALYRKYRSKSFDEIIGQPHITATLSNAIKTGKTSHAYLFTGPRGTGKTSTARILAHALNDLPYDEDATHLDIIEIDAASNRRIDEIRELRDRVHTAPTSARYKVYIIDEVHMLTKEAFNALLKTLEEPPAHAVFILATTEAHKLPETITSRTQRFTFKPADKQEVIAHLRSIAEKEGFSVAEEGLALIAEHGEGSLRDSLSMLDQVRGQADAVTLADTQAMLGIAPDTLIQDIISALSSGSAADVVELLTKVKDQGYSAGQIAKQIAGSLRAELLKGNSVIKSSEITPLLEKLLSVPTAYDQMASLELSLLEIILTRSPVTTTQQSVPAPAKAITKPVEKPQPKAKAVPPTKEATPEPKIVLEETVPQDIIPVETSPLAAGEAFDAATWASALNTIKQTHNTLYSLARMAVPTISDDELVLTFGFAFHQKRMSETKNKQIITDIVQQAAGRPINVQCVVGTTENTPTKALAVEPAVAATTSSSTLSTISNIFGGAEVLES